MYAYLQVLKSTVSVVWSDAAKSVAYGWDGRGIMLCFPAREIFLFS